MTCPHYMCAVDYVSYLGKFPENVNITGACVIRTLTLRGKESVLLHQCSNEHGFVQRTNNDSVTKF